MINIISFLATIKQGSIAVPLFEAFESDGLELRLERGDADVLITNKELAKRLKHTENRKFSVPFKSGKFEGKDKFKNMKIIVVDSSEFKNEIKKQKSNFNGVLVDKFDTATMIFTSSTAGTPVAGINEDSYKILGPLRRVKRIEKTMVTSTPASTDLFMVLV